MKKGEEERKGKEREDGPPEWCRSVFMSIRRGRREAICMGSYTVETSANFDRRRRIRTRREKFKVSEKLTGWQAERRKWKQTRG